MARRLNVWGPSIAANYSARNAEVELRLSERFSLGSRAFVKANVDIYNFFNACPIPGVNHSHGSSWPRPIAVLNTAAFLAGPFVQLGGELEFQEDTGDKPGVVGVRTCSARWQATTDRHALL